MRSSTRRGRISKENIERIEKGLDLILTEDQEAEAFKHRLNEYLLVPTEYNSNTPGVLEYTHIANETGVSFKSVQTKKNRLGLRKGFPDYCILIRNNLGEYGLVWIELKKARGPEGGLNGSKISTDQERVIELLGRIENVAAHFAHGHEEAIEIVKSYLFTQ